MSNRRVIGLVAASGLALGLLLAPSGASAWAPAASAPIHPGVQTVTAGGQCTANFLFSDGTNVYIGQAAHCSSTGGQTSTDGCSTGSLPLGTPVAISGATQQGTLAYNSWLAMQANHEADANTCAFNDIALVKVAAADVPNVNPSVPGFGGPTGVGDLGALGTTVYSYGNSSLRLGVTKLSPKQGIVAQVEGGGWSHAVYTVTPGIPGDSGSGFLTASGQAAGVLSTLRVAPLVASNGVGSLPLELAYMHANGFAGVNLVPGTEPFSADLVGAIGRA